MSERRARILLVEDEEALAQGIRENFEAEGHDVDVAYDGAAGLAQIATGTHDLVVLDVMLPELDGIEVCQRARAEGHEVPVLFLTARGSVDDRIRGLEAGGDDYLAKPFHLDELLLRVAAILKRRRWYEQGPAASTEVSFGGNSFDFRRFSGRSWDGREQSLTHKEAMILRVLSEREGEVVSRDDLLDRVWGYDLYPSSRTIDNFIVRLRKRFERDSDDPRHFHTVRGVGYRFTRENDR